MGKPKDVLENKKQRLKQELMKDKPDTKVVRDIKESIRRNKHMNKVKKQRRKDGTLKRKQSLKPVPIKKVNLFLRRKNEK